MTAEPAREEALEEAIQAATKALGRQLFGTPEQLERYARVAIEAAWPHAEGTIANAWAKVDRQREANALMQRSQESARAHAKNLAKQVAYLAEQVERIKQAARAYLNADTYTAHTAAKQTLQELVAEPEPEPEPVAS